MPDIEEMDRKNIIRLSKDDAEALGTYLRIVECYKEDMLRKNANYKMYVRATSDLEGVRTWEDSITVFSTPEEELRKDVIYPMMARYGIKFNFLLPLLTIINIMEMNVFAQKMRSWNKIKNVLIELRQLKIMHECLEKDPKINYDSIKKYEGLKICGEENERYEKLYKKLHALTL